MDRRDFLKLGAGYAAAMSGVSCLGVPRADSLEPVRDLAIELFGSLDDDVRRRVAVPYEHPLRQYHNRGVSLGGAPINRSSFSWEQMKLVNRLFYSGLSAEGREILPRQFFLRWRGLRSLRLLIVGDPNEGHYQVIFSGPHLNLRFGGRSREGVAFGGPLAYGDQRGNERQGLPGNVYQYQFRQGQELFSSLTPAERRGALLEGAPIQTQIELRGSDGAMPGIPVSDLSATNKKRVRALVDGIVQVYHEDDAAYAKTCLEKNGGVDALHLSYYEDGEVDGSGEYQIFRVEGPAAVFYFRGFPHVHAFINVAMDGNAPLSVGEVVGENPAVLEGTAVKELFEKAMRHATEGELAYYDRESVVGRLRSGTIRTGDIYNLESWINTIQRVTLRADELDGVAKEDLVRQGLNPNSTERVSIATTDFSAGENRRRAFGGGAVEPLGIDLRDAAIEYLKQHGFPRPAV